MIRNQEEDAKRLYDQRALHYEDSWHPRFAGHIIQLVRPQKRERLLDLVCGTGLVSFLASDAVGPDGEVVGVDISSGMLAQATAKQSKLGRDNVIFHTHSITKLDSLDAIHGESFDVVTCVSAFVLLPRPDEAIKQWARFLKPGGRMIIDVTHPQSRLDGLLMERIGRELNRPIPGYRLPFQSPRDLERIIENAGLRVNDTKLISQWSSTNGHDSLESFLCDEPLLLRRLRVVNGESAFEDIVRTEYCKDLGSEDIRSEAKARFLKYWHELADTNGNIDDIDGVFVTIATKPI